MGISKFAPVFIPTLNRYLHFKRCVNSLAKCTHAEKTDLFIALDYPLTEAHWVGYKEIKKFIETISEFKSITVIEREKNYGAIKNYIEGQSFVFEEHDRIIISEDDNEFSSNFLEYINKGLDKFEVDDNVLAICGHRPLIEIPVEYKFNYYYAKGFSAWGYGIWRKKNREWNCTPEQLKAFLSKKSFRNKLKLYNEKLYYSILYYIKNNRNMFGDGAIELHMIVNDKYCIYPAFAKSRNHGHDGSGVHSGTLENSIYATRKIDKDKYFSFIGNAPLVDEKIEKVLINYFKISSIKKLKRLVKKILLPN